MERGWAGGMLAAMFTDGTTTTAVLFDFLKIK